MKSYGLPKETMQGVIAFHATILRCIAERMEVKEWRGKMSYSFHFGEGTYNTGCLLCEARNPCQAIQKTLSRKVDQALRNEERFLEDSRRTPWI
jgi:hypothetical protein